MAPEKLARTSYRDDDGDPRDGTTSLAESRRDMEEHLLPLLRVHASALHGPGVATELAVTATSGGTTVTVGPGVAVDPVGRHLSLAPGGHALLGTDPDPVAVTPTGIVLDLTTLSPAPAAGPHHLTLTFTETFDALAHASSGGTVFELDHTPRLALHPAATPAPDAAVVLARVTLAANRTVTALDPGTRQACPSPTGDLTVHRPARTAAGPSQPITISHQPAGHLTAHPDGGLRLTSTHTHADGPLSVHGAVTADGNTEVRGTLTAQGSTQLRGNTAVGGTLTATGAVTASTDLTVRGTLTTDGATTLRGTTTVGGTLTTTGALTTGTDHTVRGTLTAQGTTALRGTTTVGGTLTTTGALTTGTDHTVRGTLTAQGTTALRGATTVGGTLTTTGAVTAGSDLTVAGTARIDGNLTVTNSTSVGPLAVGPAQGRLMVTGNVAELCFANRTLVTWPTNPRQGDRYVWYNQSGTAAMYTDVSGDLLRVNPDGDLSLRGSLQVGLEPVAGVTIAPTDGSPNAGFVRFGDGTGWRLHLGRFRDGVAGAPNTGLTGVFVTIQDNGTVDAQGSLSIRGTASVGQGARINDVVAGMSGDITYTFAYETLGVARVGENLRLQSPLDIIFHTGGNPPTERMKLASNGDLTLSGNLRLNGSFATNGMQILPAGGWPNPWRGGIATTDFFADGVIGLGPFGGGFNAWIAASGKVSGSVKQFVIDHPAGVPGRKLVHAAIEGPEAGVYYRGEAELDGDDGIVELPPYFEALTRPEHRTVQVTPILGDGDEACTLAVSEVRDGLFRVRALGRSSAGPQRFYWEVKAVRADLEPLDVEPDMASSPGGRMPTLVATTAQTLATSPTSTAIRTFGV